MESGEQVTLHIKDVGTQFIQTIAMPRIGEEVWLNSEHYLVTQVVHHWVTGSSEWTSSLTPIATEGFSSTVFVTKIAT